MSRREESATDGTGLAPGARLGPYEVVELLGAGGMGAVYRARDPRLGRDVAIKVLPEEIASDPDRLRRFEQEARAVAALNHPNILSVYDVGTQRADEGSGTGVASAGVPYVVTELLEGENLREVLTRRNPTQRQVLGWAVQAAQGLSAAHRKGIVHRDLKPENLFLTTEGRIKVLDFGLAKLSGGAALDTEAVTESGLTRPGLLMGTVPYMSPEQVQGRPVDARSDLFSFGVVLYELLARRHPFRRETVASTLGAILQEEPAELTGVDPGIPPVVGGIVRRCLAKRREERFQGAHDLGLAIEAVLAAPTGAAFLQEVEERSPYPGLSSFTEKDAGVFFGRESEVTALWERIRERRLRAVIGPSGAGKTSFLRAGVIPARPEGWAAIVCTPGPAPLRGLGRALGPELAGDPEALGQLADVEDPASAFALLSRWRRAHSEALVVVDQFEELFTLNPKDGQIRLADLLGRLSREADVHVLLSLRDDFLLRCCEPPPLAPILQDLTVLQAMGREDLRRALVEPARKRGYRFEDEALVDEMVGSVEGARGALPLLAFAVARLWEKRDRERKLLTREAYREIGGVAGALAQHAEAVMDRLGPERHGLVREMLRNLVTAQGTRAVIDLEELLSAFPQRQAAEEVLRQLVDARLLTTYEVEGKEGEPSRHRVEVVHESLLAAWPRLVRWQAQDEEGALLRDQLKQAAHLWNEKGRTSDLLWTGTAYQEYELWRGRYAGALTALEEDFARSMAERSRRQRRLRRLVAGSVLAAAVAVAAVTGLLWRRSEAARDRAQYEARRAEASKLLALAQARLEADVTEALALTTASLELADTREARAFAVKVLWKAPPARVLGSVDRREWGAYFSRDGRWMLAGGTHPEVRVWGDDGQGPIVLPGHEFHTNPIAGGWTSSGLLVTGEVESARNAHVWSIPDGRRLRTIEFGEPTDWQVGAEHLLGQTLEGDSGDASGRALLRAWRLPDGEMEVLGRLDWRAEGVSSIVFEPEGRGWLYTRGPALFFRPRPSLAGGDRLLARHPSDAVLLQPLSLPDRVFSRDSSGEMRLWSFTPTGAELATVLHKPATAPARTFPDPTGRWLVNSVREAREARLWDLAAWPSARPLVLPWGGSSSWALSGFHPRGNWLVVSPDQVHLVFWPLGRPRPAVVEGASAVYAAVTFSPDGRWLGSSWTNNTARLWPLPGAGGAEPPALALPGLDLTSPCFDPKGRYLFLIAGTVAPVAVDRGFVVPLDGSPYRDLGALPVETGSIGCAVSPGGRLVATGFWFGFPRHRADQKILRIWNAEAEGWRDFVLPVPPPPAGLDPAASPTGFEGGLLSLAFVDETTLLTAGHGGIRRWNLETGSHELLVASAPGRAMTMAASADGRTALAVEGPLGGSLGMPKCGGRVSLVDLATREARPLEGHGECGVAVAIDPSGTVAATADGEGVVRVFRVAGGEPHLLLGHERWVKSVAISPDRRWVATVGEDKTLRLWPMPDLDKPPLHGLPHGELLAKLRSLTNLRAVRDPSPSTGWRVEVGPFPGWKDVPTW